MYETLISAAQLAAGLQNDSLRPRVLDCRTHLGDPDFGAAAYAERHIPGAYHADLDRDFASAPSDQGRHPLPDQHALAAKLRAWGINDDDQVVVYDDAGGAFAARAWWCLRWLGHPATALLDGGLGSWPGPWTGDFTSCEPGNFSIRPTLTRSITASALSEQQADLELIDARTPERFNGEHEPIDPVAGHIPGAHCLPFQDNLERDGRFKSPESLRARFPGSAANVVCYCGSGVTAAHNVLAMRIAGLEEAILYPGSWSEWIVDPNRPRAP
ncbi:MAG: sulfurtransferase [Gammaproteobacteria bacterium]|nr:sulfurtransferase [Gammaproteobacteria bacterium]